jgi:hypothetical protein
VRRSPDQLPVITLVIKSLLTMNTTPAKAGLLAVGLVALLCAGCPGEPSGKMSGTVTYKGKPMGGGSITFATENGAATGGIDSTGGYSIDKVPLGNAKVAVFGMKPPNMKGKPFGGGKGEKMTTPKDLPADAQKMFENAKQGSTVIVPPKYNDQETSGLTVTIAAGQNPPYNIELKD